jgi:lysozyme
VPTIGFGTTSGVKLGDTTTPPKALARALTDVQQFEGALKQCVTVPLAQHEYDALVSFSYNVGSRAFCQSTLVRKLNAEDYAGACDLPPSFSTRVRLVESDFRGEIGHEEVEIYG